MAAGLKHRIRPNHFLVQLKPTAALDKHLFWLQTVTFPSLNANPTMGDGMESAVLGHVYPNFGVYSIRLTLANTGTAMAILLSDSDVQAIEPDQIISILDFDGSKTSSHYGPSFERQTNVSNWGLSRISHHLLSSSLSRKSFPYFPSFSGNNVTVYVIDTGINVNHADLHPDRVRWGTTVPKNDQNDDGHGHGTHVSGIIAGQTFGVAKNALLVAVKVLDSQGMGYFLRHDFSLKLKFNDSP